ncbi:MAG: AAA family ATPase [Planctomycetaceae bacterium]|nr:AAA family ATPase [Planctomycetaceae bacterium]|tara:strand:- start:734 stop:1537 length:804 start_codon:yes stop_codon:yes gene_type:complete
MQRLYSRWLIYLVLPLFIGALVGVLILAPVNEFADFHEHRNFYGDKYGDSAWRYVAARMRQAMNGDAPWKLTFFGLTGAFLGLISGGLYSVLGRRARQIEQLQSALGQDILTLIASGEGGNLEFKSSLRWDLKKNEKNRILEGMILKTLAGFMNGEGGMLLIGVADDGEIVGIEHDYQTLKKADQDGWEVALMTLVSSKAGTANCRYVQPVFHRVNGKIICRVIVGPASSPVYVTLDGSRKFFLRTGGSTRELDVEQAVDFIASRWS